MNRFRDSVVASAMHDSSGVGWRKKRWVIIAMVAGLFVPVFFHLGGGVYQGGVYYESGGRLSSLPVPLSIVFCGLSVVLLGGYGRIHGVLKVISLTFLGMCASVLLLIGERVDFGKVILLAQYMLPMFALIVGVQLGSVRNALRSLARGLLGALLITVSLQLTATLVAGQSILSSSALLFNVYQHLQYVPVIFVGGYLISLYSLWHDVSMRGWLLVLAALIGAYSVLSASMLALLLLSSGVLVFCVMGLLTPGYCFRSSLLVAVLALGGGGGMLYVSNNPLMAVKFNASTIEAQVAVPSAQAGVQGVPSSVSAIMDPPSVSVAESSGEEAVAGASRLPLNLSERIIFWLFYLGGVKESWTSFLFGHERPPDRSKFPSAHNYYLDFIYNFGALALLPLLALILHTVLGVWKHSSRILGEPGMLAVTGVSMFILLIDNSLKVGMRQPYPGIVSFFLWGVLLAWLWQQEEPLGT
ncbi:hypothetical protein ACQKPE_11230 [Pseudomonas sp. NPDC089554]|uniref:hypothetical protein n=1 Tax=Pseudomonas sp. NPDC089554 TaxID=3390653 RepID=UPI003D060516